MYRYPKFGNIFGGTNSKIQNTVKFQFIEPLELVNGTIQEFIISNWSTFMVPITFLAPAKRPDQHYFASRVVQKYITYKTKKGKEFLP